MLRSSSARVRSIWRKTVRATSTDRVSRPERIAEGAAVRVVPRRSSASSMSGGSSSFASGIEVLPAKVGVGEEGPRVRVMLGVGVVAIRVSEQVPQQELDRSQNTKLTTPNTTSVKFYVTDVSRDSANCAGCAGTATLFPDRNIRAVCLSALYAPVCRAIWQFSVPEHGRQQVEPHRDAQEQLEAENDRRVLGQPADERPATLAPNTRSGWAVRLKLVAKMTPANAIGANTSTHAPTTCTTGAAPKNALGEIAKPSASDANNPR